MAGRVWIDVEDMFVYADSGFNRPTGIQRFAFELCRALSERSGPDGGVQFVRHAPGRALYKVVPFAAIEQLFEGLSAPPPLEAPAPVEVNRPARLYGPVAMAARRALHRLPGRVRVPLSRYVRLQLTALGALGDLAQACAGLIPGAGRRVVRTVRRLVKRSPPPPPVAMVDDEDDLGPGIIVFRTDAVRDDVLLVVGAGWILPMHPSVVRRACAEYGLRFGLLVHDIIPLRRPEWCDRAQVSTFKRWFDGLLPLCDTVLSISNATATEVEAYAAEHAIALSGAIRQIRIGTGFAEAGPLGATPPSRLRPLPERGTYALFVSTIEARKNHALLFRVWRRLLEEMPRDTVPTLVFAGRVGWLVSDLMQQLENANYLDGKIALIEHPTDAELIALYRGCRFTLFPSLYEGWGLPVTESLAFGKPCVISNATSLPEAGGRLARYFDPEDANAALRTIRAVIADPDALLAWEAQVVREFQPTPWSVSADMVLDALRQPVMA